MFYFNRQVFDRTNELPLLKVTDQHSLKTPRILGIDPGTNILGYGILEFRDQKSIVLDVNTLQLKKFDTHQAKLREIFLRVQELIETFQPQSLSIESPFLQNAQSMHKLGRAQGVAIAAAMVMGLEIYEFSPKKIKKRLPEMAMLRKNK